MADLEANFMHLQLMHESLGRFSESFAGFLYGMNMNAFCVDFLEAPAQESFRRAYMLRPQTDMREGMMGGGARSDGDGDATFM
jgi:DASH complex subunit DAM1